MVGARGTVRHNIRRMEVEIADLEPTIGVEDVDDAVRSIIDHEPELELRVSLSKTPLRVRRKTEAKRCYRCLGFGHMAAECRGPNRSKSCWRCGEKGHVAGSCTAKPRLYIYAAREDKPRNDHIPGTMRCAAFREAAPNRTP